MQDRLETAVLANGLTVHVAHWPNRPWVAAGFVVHSGARLDPIGLEGTAHFVEHLVSRNGKTPYDDIKKFFDKIGGFVSLGTTNYKSTFYKFFSPIARLEFTQALSIFGEMLFSLKLDNFIEEQRKVIESEFHKKFKTPVEREMTWRRSRSLFKGLWLERYISPLGDPDSIERIQENHLQGYYDSHYSPLNTSVVFVGGLSLAEVMSYLNESPFSINKAGVRNPVPNPMANIEAPTEQRFVFETSKFMKMDQPLEKGVYQTSLLIPGTLRWQALRIMEAMIYDVMFKEIREKLCWTYDPKVSRYNHQSFHEVNLGFSGIPLGVMSKIEGVIESLIQSIGSREDLFQEMKHTELVDLSSLDMSGRKFLDEVVGAVSHEHKYTTTEEDRVEISKVTLEEVQEGLSWIVPERCRTVLVVP